MQMRI